MSPLLYTYGLPDYVEGKITAPKETQTNNSGNAIPTLDYHRWVSHDKFALTCLMLSVIEEAGCNLLGAKT